MDTAIAAREQSDSALRIVRGLPIALERDLFLRTLIRELAGTLQDVVGLEEASGFVSVVGQRVGEQINQSYSLWQHRRRKPRLCQGRPRAVHR
jgi:hypothetical protein